jgi:hypothetical protein
VLSGIDKLVVFKSLAGLLVHWFGIFLWLRRISTREPRLRREASVYQPRASYPYLQRDPG